MTDISAFVARAEALLGERGFTRDPDLLEPWLTDWRGRFHGKTIGIASPSSTQLVSEFVKLCCERDIPIVPQGGNSGMVGGATPDESGHSVLLSLRRMDNVRSFDTSARQIICEAGVILQNLHDLAAKERLRFPLTLGGKGSATVGGLVSTNAGGTQVLRHGTMRAQVLGIEAVLANGEIFDGLTALKKDNRGFDLKQLLIGSEGTLGIVTAANLRLLPEIGDRVVIWAGLESIQQARQLLLHFEAKMPEELEGFEVVPDHCLDSVLAHLPGARAPLATRYPWNALIELVSTVDVAQQLRDTAETNLADAIEHDLLHDAVIAANETQAEDFWTLRDEIAPAERALGPAMQHDISVPVERMPDFVEAAIPHVESQFAGTKGLAFGHLGDGNVHFHVLAPKGATPGEWENTHGKKISALIYEMVTDWGGSISAEHGIGQVKRDELQRLGDPVTLSMMKSVKQALDPQGILNPGKLIPTSI
ncbi:FAD-binding oxidoreductase [Altererythrobacter sp.]|uniref:FAD-binding oxidoreductase n=1 Tax=Altererythrobacter sp. TaxID=1872480 RepID=UPI001B1F6000|nr:FAD-binding oxidoreductase [Altererythrobacter sp.]MBO6608080.1 FAD-binding oxidoreductase [Altererythrobacter sp.]MBO6641664.1 FAD-binding oxidoreductase [Altererythrobacter sp.]MBO6707637.1 FAD-binding oxidoreductase [Altererythrobacter sp.]MBO6946231.1 FAD-binding oxidoreductase [Altererythrobacter sp.]